MRPLRVSLVAVGLWCLLVALPAVAFRDVPGTSWFGPAAVSAASPAPSGDNEGDTRSAGEGPGLVGAPLLAIGGVFVLGIGAALVTIVYVRLTGGPSGAATPSVPGDRVGGGAPEHQP